MRTVELSGAEGVRGLPDEPTGMGALVLAGSSGRIETARCELLARLGVTSESLRWFGAAGQHDGPWEIPLEFLFERVDDLARTCDRVVVMGTSFGAEAALLTGALHPAVDGVAAFAPSDVVWAGVRGDGRLTSHWTLAGQPLPYVPFDDSWTSDAEVPSYLGLYEASRLRFATHLPDATIPVERIRRLVLVAGGDDQVWPSLPMARSIEARRRAHDLDTTLITLADAGHRALLPGEAPIIGGIRMQRGGHDDADRRLGAAAWPHLLALLAPA